MLISALLSKSNEFYYIKIQECIAFLFISSYEIKYKMNIYQIQFTGLHLKIVVLTYIKSTEDNNQLCIGNWLSQFYSAIIHFNNKCKKPFESVVPLLVLDKNVIVRKAKVDKPGCKIQHYFKGLYFNVQAKQSLLMDTQINENIDTQEIENKISEILINTQKAKAPLNVKHCLRHYADIIERIELIKGSEKSNNELIISPIQEYIVEDKLVITQKVAFEIYSFTKDAFSIGEAKYNCSRHNSLLKQFTIEKNEYAQNNVIKINVKKITPLITPSIHQSFSIHRGKEKTIKEARKIVELYDNTYKKLKPDWLKEMKNSTIEKFNDKLLKFTITHKEQMPRYNEIVDQNIVNTYMKYNKNGSTNSLSILRHIVALYCKVSEGTPRDYNTKLNKYKLLLDTKSIEDLSEDSMMSKLQNAISPFKIDIKVKKEMQKEEAKSARRCNKQLML